MLDVYTILGMGLCVCLSAACILALILRRAMRDGFRWVSIVAIVLCAGVPIAVAPIGLHLTYFAEPYAAKMGRVIDVATGKAISGALIAATAEYGIAGVEGISSHQLYRVTARSAEDGSFSIPARWSFTPIAIWPRPDVTWSLQVLSPGYVNPRDRIDPATSPNHLLFGGEINTPVYRWKGVTLDFGVVELEKHAMDLQEGAIYYGSLKTGFSDFSDIEPFFQLVRQAACSGDSLSPIDIRTLQAIRRLQPNGIAFNQRLFSLEPQNSKASVYDHPTFRRGDICESLNFAAATHP